MQRIRARGEAIDNISVVQDLEDHKQLATIGGSAYITRLINNTPTHVHVGTYARLVERMAVRRRLLACAGKIAQISLEDDSEINDIIDRSQQAFMKLAVWSLTTASNPSRQPSGACMIRLWIATRIAASLLVSRWLKALDNLLVGQGWASLS